MLRTTGEAQANCSITGAVEAETTLKTRRKSFWFLTVTMAFTIMAVSICSYGQELRKVKGLNGKWGFVNEQGEEVIPFKYDDVCDFSEGLARVKLYKKWGFIDKEGRKIISYKYDDAGDFSEGLARVYRIYEDNRNLEYPIYLKKWGFIDKNGEKLIPYIYDGAGDFYEGLARVKHNGKWGFINNAGTAVISFIYDEVSDFSKGLARVRINRKWGFIDKKGKEVIYTETISEKAEKESQEKEKATLEREKAETQTQKKMEQEVVNTVTTNTYDVILLKDGQEFKAKVTEITLSEIKYKAFDHLDGPTRTLAKSNVFLINYANGTREVFGTANKASEKQQIINSAGYNYALLHIYRKGRIGGSAINYDLHMDNQVICRVKNKWYESIKIDKEGEITLWAKTEARNELPIIVEFGKEYYIRCGLDFGVVVGRPYLELVDEEIGMSEIESIQGTASQASSQQNRQQSKQKGATNSYKGAALGVNFLTGFTFKNPIYDFGFGVNVSQTFSVPFRLAGEFDILWGTASEIAFKTTVTTNSRWISMDMYGNYLLFLSNSKKSATYPLFGLGYVNSKMTRIVSGERLYEVPENFFAVTLGWGIEGRSKHFFYGSEWRIKIVAKNDDAYYRMHVVAKIGYKF